MNCERSRLRTFQNWPSNSPVSSRRIAKAGFYYMGHELEVQCFACGGRISQWNYNDSVMARHRILDPRCPFVTNIDFSGNISIEDEEKYKLESGRLASFANWPVPFIAPKDLAQTGFYYLKDGDKVKCAFCSVIVCRWENGDKADTEHARQSPNCPFLVKNSQNGNIPSQVNVINFRALDEDMRDLGVQNHRVPKSPNLSTFDCRLQTFARWPRDNHLTPESLASAGFFYVGTEDQVRCFHCDGGLLKWTAEDEPWGEHARWFPECHFVRLVKGEQFIEDTIKANPPITSADVFLAPQYSAKPVCRRVEVSNEQLQELMTSPQAVAALQIGLQPSRVKSALRQRWENSGSQFTNVDSLIEAALDIQLEVEPQSQEYDETWDEEYPTFRSLSDRNQQVVISALPDIVLAGSTQPNSPCVVTPPTTPPLEENVRRETESSAAESATGTVEEELPAMMATSATEQEDPKQTIPKTSVESVEDDSEGEDSGLCSGSSDCSNIEKPKSQILEDEVRRLKEARLCKVCMDNEVGVVLLPCGHLVTCTICASSLLKCPVCRESIKATVRTFLS